MELIYKDREVFFWLHIIYLYVTMYVQRIKKKKNNFPDTKTMVK